MFTSRFSLSVIGLVIALVPASVAATASAEEVDTPVKLLLSGALGENRPIELYAVFGEGGKAVAALSLARRYNTMPHNVDASGLALSGDAIEGSVDITVPFDGYVPKGGKPLLVDVTVEARLAGDEVKGTYKGTFGDAERSGTVTGKRIQMTAADVPRRLDLACENAAYWQVPKKKRKREGGVRMKMELAAARGRVFAARLVPHGSMTDVGMSAYAGKHEMTLEDHRLKGTLHGTVYPQGAPERAIEYKWTFDGVVIGDRIAGTMTVTEDAKEVGTGQYLGTVRAGAPKPENALVKLTLAEAIPPHNFIDVRLSIADGKVLHGFGTSPNFNNAIHTLDVSKLRLGEGRRIEGTLDVTIQPDGWIPKDRKPIPCRFELNAAVRQGEVTGTHHGTFGDAGVRGEVAGRLDPKPDLSRIDGLTLKIEDGPFGRGFFTLEYADGKFVKGRVWNNHSDLTGEVRKADLSWEGEKLTGSLTAYVEKGGAKPGVYTVKPDGVLVGTIGAGQATTTAEDGREKTASFWVALKPAP